MRCSDIRVLRGLKALALLPSRQDAPTGAKVGELSAAEVLRYEAKMRRGQASGLSLTQVLDRDTQRFLAKVK